MRQYIEEEQQRGDSGIPYNRLIFVLIWKLFVLILKILILVLNWIFKVKVLFNVLYKGHPLPLPSMMYVRTYKMVTAKDYHLWYNQDLTGIFAKECMARHIFGLKEWAFLKTRYVMSCNAYIKNLLTHK